MEPIADEAGGIQRCVEQLFASEEFGRRYRHRPIFAIVAHEFGRYNGHGGIAVYLENLIDSLIAHSNYHIHLFCHGLGPYRPSPRLTVTHIPDGDLKSADFVAQALDRIDPQVVEVADYNGLTSQFLLRRAMGQTHSKCRIIVNHHTGSREIWEWGTLTDFDAVASTDLRFTAIAEAAQNSLADAHVSVSAFLASYLEQRYHLPRITPLYPCFPQAEADSTSSAGNRDGLHILSLGRFELRKRQDLLIRACTELLREGMHLHVTFAGNSIEDFRSGEDYRTACYALIDRDLRDHFTFHDFLSPQASHPLFAQADLFVIPSPRENFPTTALEAITQGLPVCGSRTSGVAELMGADTSLLFAPDDIAAIKQALRHAADIGQPGLDAIAQEQRLRTRALLAPETAIAARLAHFDTVVPRSLDQIISHPPVLALLPAAMADTAPHARAAGQVEMFGNEPLTRRPIPDGGLFLYCPTPPSDDILQAMLEQAGSADFLDEQTLICCAPDLKKGLDRTRMLAQHVTYPIIGRICLEPSKGQPPRTSDQLVADALLRATKLFYLYCPGAKAGPMSRAITARLDEKLFPFQNPVT
ncbi:glycosyltransferase family 4 protein [Sphingobium sp. AP49]|uniref:glycosyltransferase family 4 protein n=1 Tax=Sphingobium sp. AP49 TaxID=1144307 RepID=UPI0003117071|nr:glycosyltransferase family 4 protein [Sphingobium sp. AP49]WHO39971.1 glycosyltransferase family 4 protein [Sphingobium sp. AP49]